MRYFHIVLFFVLINPLFSSAVNTTIWTVTASNNGHTSRIKNPVNAMSDMTDLVAEAKTWLAAHNQDSLVLYFPYNTYVFVQPNISGISISGFTNGNLVIRGEKQNNTYTKFQFQIFDFECFRVRSSNKVTIEKLWLTRGGCGDEVNGLYTSQGTFLGTGNDGENYITFRKDAGFPDPAWLASRPNSFNNERTFIAFRGPDNDPVLSNVGGKVALDTGMVAPIVLVSGDIYKAYLSGTSFPTFWTSGVTRIALKTKCGAHTIRLMDGCDDCVLQDLKITNFSGNPIRGLGDMDRLLVQRVEIARSEPINGITPFFSGPSGGIQLYCGIEGAIVRDCSITATADDGIGYFSTDNADLLTQNGIIENNTIRDTQARGIIITFSENGICRNNTIIRCDAPSILIKNESGAEGSNAAVRNWHVTNNTFIQSWVDAVISFQTECIVSGLHNNNYIDNNTFIEAPKNNPIIYITNADKTFINNNTIVSFSDEDDYHNTMLGTSNALVSVRSGISTTGSGNIFQQVPYPSNRPANVKVVPSNLLNVSWIYDTTADTTGSDYQKKIHIFPNPFVDEINIKNFSGNEIYTLYDVSGKKLEVGNISAELTFRNVKSGLYFLKITDVNQVIIAKQKISKL